MKTILSKSVLSAALVSASKEGVRQHLNTVLIEALGEMYRAVSTDGHRLTVISGSLSEAVDGFAVSIPRETVELAVKTSKGLDGISLEHENDKWLLANVPFAPCETQFPDYCRVLSGVFSASGSIHAIAPKYLLDAEKQAILLTGKKTPHLSISYIPLDGKALIRVPLDVGSYASVVMATRNWTCGDLMTAPQEFQTRLVDAT